MNNIQLCGYINKSSFNKNENIDVYVHFATEELINLEILDRYGNIIGYRNKIKTICQEYKPYSFAEGCNWKKTISITINFNIGYYLVKIYPTIKKNFPDDQNERPWLIPFIVNNDKPINKILVLDNSITREAYNTWASLDGSISLYKWDPTLNTSNKDIEKYVNYKKNWSNTVSFLRPNLNALKLRAWNFDYENTHLNNKVVPELYGMKWLDDNKFKYDIINDIDFHKNPDILLNYKVFLNFGHNEYWTKEMIEGLKKFIINGGNFMNLAGNSLYWKATLKDNQLQVMKNNELHTHDNTVGGYWNSIDNYQLSVKVCNLMGAYLNKGIDQYSSYPYKITKPKHWVFKNINSEIIGENNINKHFNYKHVGASGWEVDEIKIDSKYSLGKSTHINVKATNDLIYYINKGRVFNAGSVVYSGSLLVDKNLSILTKNVLNNFLNDTDNDKNFFYEFPKTLVDKKYKILKNVKVDLDNFKNHFETKVEKINDSLKLICTDENNTQGVNYDVQINSNSTYELIIKGNKSAGNFRAVPVIRNAKTGVYIWKQNYYDKCLFTSNIQFTENSDIINIKFNSEDTTDLKIYILFYNIKLDNFIVINSIELNEIC